MYLFKLCKFEQEYALLFKIHQELSIKQYLWAWFTDEMQIFFCKIFLVSAHYVRIYFPYDSNFLENIQYVHKDVNFDFNLNRVHRRFKSKLTRILMLSLTSIHVFKTNMYSIYKLSGPIRPRYAYITNSKSNGAIFYSIR